MPIYEYHCEDCDCEFEVLVFRGDEQNVTCPNCGKKEVTRLMSSASIGGSGLGSCLSGGSGGFS